MTEALGEPRRDGVPPRAAANCARQTYLVTEMNADGDVSSSSVNVAASAAVEEAVFSGMENLPPVP